MNPSLLTLIALYIFPPGRAQFALQGVRDLTAGEAALAHIHAHAEAGVAFLKETAKLRLGQAVAGAAPPDRSLVVLDNQLDTAVGTVQRLAQEIANNLAAPEGEEEQAQLRHAQTLLAQLYPEGAAAYTHKAWPEQDVAVEGLVEALESTHREAVAALGLEIHVKRLKKLHADFHTGLQRTSPAQLTPALLGARDAKAQVFLREVIAMTLGAFPLETAEQLAARARILAPLFAQVEAIQQARARRRRVRDVDADTGDVLVEPPAPAPGNAPTA